MENNVADSNGDCLIFFKNKNGIHRWLKTKTDQEESTILFCEPSTLRNVHRNFGFSFKVPFSFIKLLLKNVQIQELEDSNMYYFGKIFHLSEYCNIEYHMNDIAQTVFVDVTKITKSEENQLTNMNKWESFLEDKNNLPEIRKTISPRILFLAETPGGDVGATLFAHFNKQHEIDGLMIWTGFH